MRGMNTNTNTSPFEFAGLDDWFPVFRTGSHTAANGTKVTITQADLDSIVRNFDAGESAPFVVGHPKTDDPAYGWVNDLKRDGDDLLVRGKDVVPEFSQAVEQRLYPKRSVKIAPLDKGYQLIHVGFLGAQPPAVKGLAGIRFNEPDNALEFESAMPGAYNLSYALGGVGGFMRRLREWFIAEHDQDTADRLIPNHEIDSVKSAAKAIVTVGAESDFSEPHSENNKELSMDKNNNGAFSQADLDSAVTGATGSLQTENDKLKKQLDERAFNERKKDAATLVDSAVAQGRLLPSQKAGFTEFMASLSDEPDAAFEFSAGDKKEKKTQYQFMSDLIGRLGKQIELGADESEGPDAAKAAVAFNAPLGATVDQAQAKVRQDALEYQRKHQCDFITAVEAVKGDSQ